MRVCVASALALVPGIANAQSITDCDMLYALEDSKKMLCITSWGDNHDYPNQAMIYDDGKLEPAATGVYNTRTGEAFRVEGERLLKRVYVDYNFSSQAENERTAVNFSTQFYASGGDASDHVYDCADKGNLSGNNCEPKANGDYKLRNEKPYSVKDGQLFDQHHAPCRFDEQLDAVTCEDRN